MADDRVKTGGAIDSAMDLEQTATGDRDTTGDQAAASAVASDLEWRAESLGEVGTRARPSGFGRAVRIVAVAASATVLGALVARQVQARRAEKRRLRNRLRNRISRVTKEVRGAIGR